MLMRTLTLILSLMLTATLTLTPSVTLNLNLTYNNPVVSGFKFSTMVHGKNTDPKNTMVATFYHGTGTMVRVPW